MANKTARLGDLATYINGYAFKPADWGDTGLPIIRIQDLTGNSYQLNRYDGEYPERIEVNDGDVLISWSASLGVYVWQRGKALLNQHIFKVVFDKLPVNKDYFVFAVEHKLAEMESKTHGATMKHIVKKDFDGTTIPYPPIEKQAEIADHLRRITSLIDRQTEQMLLLDQLVKSRFIELFGTIHDNRFGFGVVTLQDVSAPIKDGTHQTPTYTTDVENGYKFLSSKDVTTGKVDWSHLKYIPEELHRELYARISPRRGDILLAKNGTTGIAAIVDRDEVFDIYVSLALIRPHGVDPTYLWAAINAAETKQQFDASLKGIGVPNLHLGEIKKARIILPPMELQKQFATFVEQTDKSKLAVQKGLQELEILKKSLMQQYFG